MEFLVKRRIGQEMGRIGLAADLLASTIPQQLYKIVQIADHGQVSLRLRLWLKISETLPVSSIRTIRQ